MRASLRRVEGLLACREAALGFGADVRLDGGAFGQRIVRQPRLAELELQRAAPRDLDGVVQRLRNVGEQLGHLLRRSQVLRRRVPALPVRIGELRAVGDADARFVRFEVAGGEEAHVVGGHHRNAGLLAQRHGLGHQDLVIGAPEALELEVVAIAEELLPVAREHQRIIVAAVGEGAADVALGESRQRDQPRRGGVRQPAAIDERNAAILALRATRA